MNFKLYTKTVCPQCFPVKTYIKKHNIEVEIINVDDDESLLDYVKSQNVSSMPYMERSENGEITHTSFGKNAAVDIMKWHKEGLI